MLSLNLNKPNLKYLKFKDFDSIQLFLTKLDAKIGVSCVMTTNKLIVILKALISTINQQRLFQRNSEITRSFRAFAI